MKKNQKDLQKEKYPNKNQRKQIHISKEEEKPQNSLSYENSQINAYDQENKSEPNENIKFYINDKKLQHIFEEKKISNTINSF